MQFEDPRAPLLDALRQYRASDRVMPGEKTSLQRLIAFVETVPTCFERSEPIGHVTGSAWVLDHERNFAVLLHHRKLGLWVQPGGHADGASDIRKVALDEATEETGLEGLSVADPMIFDVDVHPIPARKSDPPHFHYDVRYVVVAPPTPDRRPPPLRLNEESRAGQWVSPEDTEGRSLDASVRRMVSKWTARLRS